MSSAEVTTIIGQLGASGIFVIGIAIVSSKFYAHYESEIAYLRAKVDILEKQLLDLKEKTNGAH